MRGTISQGIVFHLKDFPEITEATEGLDVTSILRITKIVTDEERRLAKEEKGIDPAKIKLSRVYQNHQKFANSKFGKWCLAHKISRKIVLWLLGTGPWVVTEKLDGSSATYILEKKRFRYEFYVCSRNVRQMDVDQKNWYKEVETNIYWEQAIKYNLQSKMKEIFKMLGCKKTLVLQGEVVGPKVQATPYGLKERDLYLFNLKIDGVRRSTYELFEIARFSGLQTVPILGMIPKLPDTMEAMKALAEGRSMIGECAREGLVYRDPDGNNSFKNVSNSFLLKG